MWPHPKAMNVTHHYLVCEQHFVNRKIGAKSKSRAQTSKSCTDWRTSHHPRRSPVVEAGSDEIEQGADTEVHTAYTTSAQVSDLRMSACYRGLTLRAPAAEVGILLTVHPALPPPPPTPPPSAHFSYNGILAAISAASRAPPHNVIEKYFALRSLPQRA
jgi:hypothetical protein